MRIKLNQAFTLTELLAVLLIITIVAGIAIPAFYRFSKSAGLSAGAQQLAGTLSLARQYAITHREYTYVVFPCSASTASLSNKKYVAYSVISTSNRNAAACSLVSKWESLPNGVVFAGTNSFSPANFSPDTSLQITNFTVASISNSSLAYIQFKPTGAASRLSTISLVEGFIATNSSPTRTGSNYVNVIVEPLTGLIRTERPQLP